MATPKETIHLGQLEIRFFEDSDSTDGRLSLFEFVVPSRARVPAPHYHAHVDEALYQLEGTLNFAVAGKLTNSRPATPVSSRAGSSTALSTRHRKPRARSRCSRLL